MKTGIRRSIFCIAPWTKKRPKTAKNNQTPEKQIEKNLNKSSSPFVIGPIWSMFMKGRPVRNATFLGVHHGEQLQSSSKTNSIRDQSEWLKIFQNQNPGKVRSRKNTLFLNKSAVKEIIMFSNIRQHLGLLKELYHHDQTYEGLLQIFIVIQGRPFVSWYNALMETQLFKITGRRNKYYIVISYIILYYIIL